MPLVRYEIRNEYSLANAELYRSAGKDDPQALLEGVAMAGLVGIVRQLGDLAEFAAEIFHDLHEEVMATAARGHGLMIRVQQLEAEFPSVEKALMSEKNQLRFAYATGADWHASIRNDQNHLTQGDLPRFILNSYEECRGPPRLFLLDKFDVAGAGACLKRYTDPSFFKMEWASTELMKAEKAQRDKKARRVKKKGRRRRNSDTTDVTPVNSRVRYSSLDLDHPKCIPSNLVNMSNQKLKSKEIDRSPLLKQQIVRDHTKGPLNISSPHEDERVHEKFSVRFDKRLNSKHFYASPVQDQVIGRQYVESPYKKSLSSEDVHESSSREWEEKPAVRVVHRVKLADNLTTVSSTEPLSSRIIAEVDAERVPKNFIHEEQKDVLVHNERKSEINVVEDENEDVASEAENYMDALTSMEYEMETDSESRTKQEVDSDINSEHKETGEELHERSAQFSEFANAEANAFYNCDSSDESSKVETSSGFFYKKPADVSSNAESTSHTVNTTSESDSANVDLNRRLDSGPLSLGTSKEDSASAFDDGSSLASEAHKNLQVTSDEKLHEIHAQCSEFTDAKDFALDNCDSSDKSSKVENILGFFNNNLADVSLNEESTSYTLNATSECAAAKVDLNRRVYSEHESLGTSKEDLDSDFDNGSSFPLESLKYDQIPLDEKLQSEADITAKEEMLNVIDVPPAVTDARSHVVISNVETNNFVNGEFSSFTNNYRTDSFTNAEAIAGIDDGEVPFRFPTFESSLLGTEELQTPYKEPMSTSECFDGIVAGANLQISSPKVHKDEDNDDYHVFSNSIINESAATSELAAGFENGIMQDNHKCIDLQTDDTEYEMAEPIRDDPSDTQNVQLLSGPSSPGLVGQISVESDVNIDHSEYSAESMPQDSLYDEYIGSGMDYKLIDKQHCPDRCLDHVPAMKPATVIGDNEEPPEYACEREALKPTVGSQDSDLAESKSTESTLHVRPLNVPRCLDHVPAMKLATVIGDNEEPPEYACEREALKPIVGSQDSDLAESKSTESTLIVRPLNVPPQLNVPDGYRGDQVTENSSSNTLLTEDSTVCSAVNFGATSDGTNLLVKDIGDDITQKEANIHSEEPVALDSATVKFPFLRSISDNACRNELSNEFPGAETSVNDGVLPDGSPHSRSTELCGDGGPFENGISIESHSNLHLRAPNELFSSPPSTNSFSKNVHMDSPHAESDMQILYAIPPVKPNVTPHSRSVGHFSDGGSFENNVDIESHGNLQHGTPTEVFSSLASTNSFSEKVHPYSLHADSDMQILHAIPPVKPVGAEPLAESPTNFPKTEVHDGELSSPPLEHIKISFPPTSDSPLSMYSTSSDRVSESPSLERRQLSKRKADDLSSSFHLLPEPAIPLHRADENQSIGIMGSFSSHRQRKSSETLSDKIISQMRDTDDDSEGEGWNEFGKSSPEISNEFYIQSLEPTDGLAVFSGRTAVSDADTGSPGVLSTTSRTISSSPETTRNSLLNFKCSSADAGSSSSHSRNISLGSSPRSLIVSAPHSPVSVEETCHRNQDLSLSQSPALESGASVRTSSTLEPNLECNWHEMQPTSPETCHKNEDSSQSQFSAFESGALVPTSTVELNSECHRHEDLSTGQFPAFDSRVLVPTSNLETNSECNVHELPPPPPLPPLEWRMMKPRQMPSLPLLLGVEPPTPPALPPPIMMNSSIQDDSPSLVPATQKSIVERKDSLIEAIASHDKTTLKKVPKLLHSISAKPVDDREELLEQIRTRSFNLRRTSVVKQNIPRPATNINVAAILEKANAIRQAFAGSDEDEEDEEDWSDT